MKKEIALGHQISTIIADGAIASQNWGDGRLIPAIIIDTTNNPSINTLIELHASTPPGDATSQWAYRRFDRKHIFLKIEFHRPVRTVTYIAFNKTTHIDLIHGIVCSKAIYLQSSAVASKPSDGINKPKILVEIAAQFEDWNKTHLECLIAKYKKGRAPKKDIKRLTEEHIKRTTEIWGSRIGQKKPEKAT